MKTSSLQFPSLLSRVGLLVPILALLALFAQNVRAAGGYPGAVQADGPIAYWRFNDTPPTAANAGSLGAAANGTYNGGATAGAQAPRPPALIGFEANNTALQCDGTAGFMGTAISLMNGRPVYTISGWMRRNVDQAARTGLWGQNDLVEFGYIDNNTIQLWTDNGLNITPNPIPNGEWAHFAMVATGSGNLASLYTNGVLAVTRTQGTIPADNAFFFNIGGGGVFDGTGNFFNGQIDEVAVFDKALTAAQIAAQYQGAFAPLVKTNVFAPGDPIVLVNGVNDGDADAGAPPGAETVDHAIDRFTQKYLNFLDLGSGFATTPSVGGTVVEQIRFYTANDAEPRDPASYLLEGSTSGLGGPWTTIASGPLSLPSGRNQGGQIPIDPATQFNQLVEFPNNTLYTSYRVTFPTLKDAANANSMQIGEVELLGTIVVRAPRIVTQPADQTLRQGLEATFTVSADGTPPLTYQWFRKLASEANFSAVAGANAASYITPSTRYPEDDNSLFKVQVSNSVGTTASREATLRVMRDTTPPTIVSVLGSSDFMHVTINYSEEVETATSQDPLNYGLDGGVTVTAAVRSPDRRSVTLETTMQAENTIYTLTVNEVEDLAVNKIVQNSQATFRSYVLSCGGVLFEAYAGIGGNAVSDLTGHPSFPNNPTERRTMPVFDTRTVYPDNSHEGYGGRARGLFIPPTSGNWLFYLGSDDASRLFLNPAGPNAAGKMMIVEETGCCNPWSVHVSAPIALTAGQGYYIEALLKEGTGGDYLKVAARLQGSPVPEDNPNGQIEVSSNAIPSSMLGYPAAPSGIGGGLTISQQPQNQTTLECRMATFCVSASNPNDLPICYQWRSNGVEIAGANGPCHTTPLLALSNNGEVYDCIVSVIGTRVTSSSATLSVSADTAAPVCLEAHGTASLTNAVLTFDEILDSMSAIDIFSYSVDPPLSVVGASLDPSGKIVTLTFGEMQSLGASYCITATGVKDCSGANMTAGAQCCFRAFIMTRGCVNEVKQEIYMNIGNGVNVFDLTSNPTYPNSPSVVRSKPSVQINTVDEFDNYGSRMSGYLVPPVSGNYHFAMSSDDGGEFLLSTDSNPANRTLLCNEPVWNGRRDWLGTARRITAAPQNRSATRFPAGIPLVAGQYYYFEALMKEGGGGDNLAVTWQIPGDPAISAGSPPLSAAYVVNIFEGLADPAGASITVTQHPQNTEVVANTPFSLSAAATGTSANGPPCVLLTWQKDDGTGNYVDVPGAVGSPGNFFAAAAAPNCDTTARYRAKFESLGAAAVYSDPANVHITPDTTPPQIISAVRGAIARDQVTVKFDEALDAASANNAANYTIDNGVMVSGAALGPNGRTVVLSTTPALANGACYTLTVGAVRDLCGNNANAQAKIILVGAHAPTSGDPNNIIVIEAEDADGRAPARGRDWVFDSLGGGGGFSGTGYLQNAPNGGATVGDTDLNAERVDYQVYLPVAGTWYVWARSRSPDALGNSCFLGIDGARPTTGYRFGNGANWNDQTWRWDFALNDVAANAAQLTVAAAGLHTLNIWSREDGLEIDKILLLPAAGIPPGSGLSRGATILGPAATPREISVPPPTVAITSPADGSMLPACEPATICADAQGGCGQSSTIMRVDFFANGQPIGSANSSPWCITLPGELVAPGVYALTAKATDSLGQMTVSAPAVGVMVADKGPRLSCPSGLNVPAGLPVDYGVTAVDACDRGPAPVTCVPPSGTAFTPGVHMVTCTATDSATNQTSCSFNVTARVAEPPRITTIALCTGTETNTFISPNGSNVCFVLDASLTPNPGGNPLTYAWFLDGSVVPFAMGVTTTNCFEVGEHIITLVVDDGRSTRSTSVTVEVLLGCEAVEALITKVNDASLARANKRPLIATLKAACASFERGSFHSALGQLGAFINKVRAQIEPANPDEAALFTRCAQSIIDSVECEEAGGP